MIRLTNIWLIPAPLPGARPRRISAAARSMVDAPARAPEQKIAETAVVCLRGQILRYQAYHYYMLHKPAGVLTADGRPQSADGARSVPAGAVALAQRSPGGSIRTRPACCSLRTTGTMSTVSSRRKSTCRRSVSARTDGQPTSADVDRFAQGVVLGDGTQCLPARLELLPEQGGCRVTVYEGKYHMVKRMLAGCGRRSLAAAPAVDRGADARSRAVTGRLSGIAAR